MRLALAVAGCLLSVLWPTYSAALQKPSPRDRVLPDFDTRWGPGRRAALDPRSTASRLELLRSRVSGPLRLRTHPGSGALRVLWAGGEPLSDAAALEARVAARRFLEENAALFGMEAEAVQALAPGREDAVAGGRLRRLIFEQVVAGIPVFEGVVVAHLDGHARVVKLLAGPLHRGRAPEEPAPVAALEAERALAVATAALGPELKPGGRRRSSAAGPAPQAVSARPAVFEKGDFVSDIPASLVWFPTAESDRLAWRLRLEPPGLPQVYDVLVDAHDGTLLYRRNLVRYADGVGTVPQSDPTALLDPRQPDEHPLGAFASGPGDPPGGCPPVSGYTSRALVSAFRDPVTVLEDGGRLRGNNTRVFRTTPGVFGALGTLDGGLWRFDYPFGSAESVETALFFSSNFAHDFFYDLGFDEAAGDFQADNFGRGGAAGDPLRTLSRADGRNNATFEPAPEGQSPTMSLFLFDAAGCWAEDLDGDGSLDIDGGYDADIVLHEFHHGVSWRLNPSFTGPEADAIGEGGGDFFAYSVFGNTRLAEYAVPPLGIREINGKTYADFTCFFFFFCEPHDNGEIWANVLWDLREGFRTDLVGGSEAMAVSEVHHLYVDALALSPPSPTMLDLRDAILQADGLRNPDPGPGGSENHCRVWSAFAGRGMGVNAQDTQDTGDNTVVADEEIPAECPQPLRVSLVVADAQAAEAGLDPGAFTVSRTGDSSADLSVLYTVAGTATPGADYEPLSGTVVIPAGSSGVSLPVIPVDDSAYELLETVIVTLASDPAYEPGTSTSGTVRISNDDAGPDLVVSVLSAPATVAAGAAVLVSETTRNQGAGPAAASVTTIHLSTNTIFDAGDISLGSRVIPELAAGASSVAANNWLTIPPDTAPGSYFLLARADAESTVTETSESNNLRTDAISVGPDLLVSALSAPATAEAGSWISVTDTTRNQGGAVAAPSSTTYYLSANTAFDAADLPLGSRSVPELGASAISTITTSVLLPSTTGTGLHYVLARADGPGQVAEANEANNVRVDAFYVGPDLVVSLLSVPATAAAGTLIDVSDTTKNQGGGAATASTTSYHLSTNATFDAADVLLGTRLVPALTAGATSAAVTSVALPATTTPGLYYVLARADGNGVVLETNEGNNLRTDSISVGTDLVVTALTAPAAAGAGATIVVNDTTRNQGGGPAPSSSTGFYLSTNSVFDAADVPLGARPVPDLLPGGSSAGPTSLVIPATTATGLHYILARADGGGLVPEASETNNLKAVAVQVGPDLVVSTLTAPATAVAGTMVNVNDTTRNQGAGSAAASSTTFYLSINTVFDGTDVVLGSRNVAELGANASSASSTGLVIPLTTAAGAYYILARADGDTLVPETNENNNTRSFRVTISAP